MKPYYEKDGITIYCGDCLEVMPLLDDSYVDSIVTDPPYPKEYIPLYSKAWAMSDRLLSPPAGIFAMCGQYCLPDVIRSFPEYWEYLWCGCFENRMMATSIWPRGISSAWKPLLIYGKGLSKFKPWKYDTFSAHGHFKNGKTSHKWGQEENQFFSLFRRFEIRGRVLDPFMGTGTTLVAAKMAGCAGIGIELEEKYCKVAVKRLEQGVFSWEQPNANEDDRVNV